MSLTHAEFVTRVVASSLPSLYCSPIESTRLNTQRVTVRQGVSLVLLECSPGVLLTFLMPRPLPRAQSQSAFWPSSALTFRLPPWTPPRVLPEASCVLSGWHFPRPLREEKSSQPHPHKSLRMPTLSGAATRSCPSGSISLPLPCVVP